jgi:hypothetical protein
MAKGRTALVLGVQKELCNLFRRHVVLTVDPDVVEYRRHRIAAGRPEGTKRPDLTDKEISERFNRNNPE